MQLEPQYKGELAVYLWPERPMALRELPRGSLGGLEENRNQHTGVSMFQREGEMLKRIVETKREALLQDALNNPIKFPE